ncbi:carboxymuconolactone decarboxylase family protein [Nonomuraea dietziae]|uniref:carboxymuconolactone decarboxylase family protein n=1 Tax=Nonomuraea dietziae TaxID=65515 RepID=UPI0033DEF5CB
MDTQRISLEAVAPLSHRAMTELDDVLRGESLLDDRLRLLVKIRTAQLNGCAHSLDHHTRRALAMNESSERLHQLAGWRGSPLFSAAERAAVELAEAVTRLPEGGVPDTVYDAAECHLGPHGVATLIMTVALANAADRMRVAVRSQPVAEVPAGR